MRTQCSRGHQPRAEWEPNPGSSPATGALPTQTTQTWCLAKAESSGSVTANKTAVVRRDLQSTQRHFRSCESASTKRDLVTACSPLLPVHETHEASVRFQEPSPVERGTQDGQEGRQEGSFSPQTPVHHHGLSVLPWVPLTLPAPCWYTSLGCHAAASRLALITPGFKPLRGSLCSLRAEFKLSHQLTGCGPCPARAWCTHVA